jgi:Leucine-rich repeat (LRR) protein
VLERKGLQLKVLNVSGNALRALPSVVWDIETLVDLDASDNALTSSDVPFEDLLENPSSRAPNLRVLDVRGNLALVEALRGREDVIVEAMAKRGVRVLLK